MWRPIQGLLAGAKGNDGGWTTCGAYRRRGYSARRADRSPNSWGEHGRLSRGSKTTRCGVDVGGQNQAADEPARQTVIRTGLMLVRGHRVFENFTSLCFHPSIKEIGFFIAFSSALSNCHKKRLSVEYRHALITKVSKRQSDITNPPLVMSKNPPRTGRWSYESIHSISCMSHGHFPNN